MDSTRKQRSGVGLKRKNDGRHVRSKYTDPSQRFVDWVNSLDLEKSFLGRGASLLERHNEVPRLAVLALFSLLLAYLINFDFDFVYTVQPGEIAPSDIKSPLSFEIEDVLATEEKRSAAAKASPPVFDYDPKAYDQLTDNVYRAFRFMREKRRGYVIDSDDARRDDVIRELLTFKQEFENLLGTPLSERYFTWLVENNFSARIESLVIRVLENWSDLKIALNLDKFLEKDDENIVVRVVQRERVGAETVTPRSAVMDSSSTENFTLRGVPEAQKFSAADQRMILKLAQSLLVPNLTRNSQETVNRKKRARDSVSPIMLSVKKNQTIVSAGSLVQPIHMTLIGEIRRLRTDSHKDLASLALAFLFVTLVLVFFSYLRRFTLNRVSVSGKDLMVMSLIMFGTVALTKLFLHIADAAVLGKWGHMVPASALIFLAPVASGPMLVGLLISSGEVVWLFTLFMAIGLGFLAELKFVFVVVVAVSGIAAARGVFKCKRRNDIYRAGIRTGLVQGGMIFFALLGANPTESFQWNELLWGVPMGFLSGILSSLVAMMFIPLLETMFNYTTDIKLLELSNLDHPLLKEMLVKAPGTYHHSLIVGSMVEAAAEEIGANPLLAKVMSYYHDIGKTGHAQYFIENQRPGSNPHDHLSPHMSKTVLIAHVKDGVELGMHYKLGKPIIDGIVQHHGTTLIAYFYNKAREKVEDESEISEEEFRYPGPKPQFKEAALVMLADSIEAAARSLDEPNPMRLRNIVKNIIQRKFVEGQLEECDLSLRDLHIIEVTFYRSLLSIYHHRIDYPRSAGGGAAEAPGKSSSFPARQTGNDSA